MTPGPTEAGPPDELALITASTVGCTDSALHRFLDRWLFRLELTTAVALLLLTLRWPMDGRAGVPTWALVVAVLVYKLLAEVVRNRVPWLHAFPRKYIAELVLYAVVYIVGAQPGGPLFVLFFLGVVCAVASLQLAQALVYTAAAAIVVAGVDLVVAGVPPSDATFLDVGARLLLLAVFAAGSAILTRRLAHEEAASRRVRGEASRLAELDRLRAEFISSVSHELRTPLTAARAGLGLLGTSAGERLRPDEQSLLENAQRNAEQLGRLIDDLLAHNQLEAGTLKLDLEPLDLRDVALSTVELLRPLLREKQQIVEVDLADALPCRADARRIQQVLANLLTNAQAHTPSGTRISFAGRVTDGKVRLAVKDNGPGIPENEQKAIFQRFYRVTTTAGASGLGLAIARALVELHGGTLVVRSAPGHGSTFELELPCDQPESISDSQEDAA